MAEAPIRKHPDRCSSSGLLSLTVFGKTGSEVSLEIKWILDGERGRVPELLKLRQRSPLLYGHNESLPVELLSEEVEKTNPEFSHALPVPAVVGPHLVLVTVRQHESGERGREEREGSRRRGG